MQPHEHLPGLLSGRINGLSRRIKGLEGTLEKLKGLDVTVHEIQYIVYNFVEKTKEGIVLIQDEMVVWANKAGCNILGYELEEVVNKSAVEMAHPKYRDQLSARYAMVQAGEDIPPGLIWPFITKTREIKYLKPFTYGVKYMGRPAIMSFFFDVSEERKLQEEQTMRAEMLELVGDYIFMLDAKGRIKYVNKAMYESLGYTKDEMLGRSILDFHTKEHAEKVKIRLKLATPSSQGTYKTEYVCKEGTLVPVFTRGKAIRLGGTDYILAVARPLETHDTPI
jgi:PAS domain S-box-containing protein